MSDYPGFPNLVLAFEAHKCVPTVIIVGEDFPAAGSLLRCEVCGSRWRSTGQNLERLDFYDPEGRPIPLDVDPEVTRRDQGQVSR